MPEIKSTKSKAERTIPLPRHLLDELSPKEETGFLLNSYTDLSRENPLSYTEAAKSFKRIQKQCGVEGYTAHDFRDTCATEWRESRISIGLIARLLGHKKTMLRNKDMPSTDPNYSIKSRIKWMFME